MADEPTKTEKCMMEAAGWPDCAKDEEVFHTWRHENPMAGGRVCYTRGNADAAIDHVFVHKSPGVVVEKVEVVLHSPPFSDHYGVLATIIVGPI
jgi:endonuclease/exonuclease/phosphatase family metal-dependent hydrolase